MLAPFVSRDSMYKYIIGELQAANTMLAAGGSSFPFTIPAGFHRTTTKFSTPTGFAMMTNAYLAKAAVLYATEGGPASAWTTAAKALKASFLNDGPSGLTANGLNDGLYQVYSTATGDAPNPLNASTNTSLYAHMSIQAQVQLKTNGDTDSRYVAKLAEARASRVLPGAAASTLGFKIWPLPTAPMAEIRNEELILLRSEVKLATGDLAGAIADLNLIRTNSGGLPPSTLTPASGHDAISRACCTSGAVASHGRRPLDRHRRYGY